MGGPTASGSNQEANVRYAILIYDTETANPAPAPPDPKVWEETMGSYNDSTAMLRDRGAYAGGEPLQPVTTATTVRVRDGETLTTDGPFAETKEQLVGFFVLECKDLDEAIELAARIPAAAAGSIEIRPVNLELRQMVHCG